MAASRDLNSIVYNNTASASSAALNENYCVSRQDFVNALQTIVNAKISERYPEQCLPYSFFENFTKLIDVYQETKQFSIDLIVTFISHLKKRLNFKDWINFESLNFQSEIEQLLLGILIVARKFIVDETFSQIDLIFVLVKIKIEQVIAEREICNKEIIRLEVNLKETEQNKAFNLSGLDSLGDDIIATIDNDNFFQAVFNQQNSILEILKSNLENLDLTCNNLTELNNHLMDCISLSRQQRALLMPNVNAMMHSILGFDFADFYHLEIKHLEILQYKLRVDQFEMGLILRQYFNKSLPCHNPSTLFLRPQPIRPQAFPTQANVILNSQDNNSSKRPRVTR